MFEAGFNQVDGGGLALTVDISPKSPSPVLAGAELLASLGWAPLFSLLPQGVLLVDRAGLCLEANPAAAQLLGLGRERLLGNPVADLLAEVLASPGGLARTQANGETLWLEFTLQPGPEGSLLVVCQDLTRRKEMENALRQSEFFFKESQRAAAIGSYNANFLSGFWTSSTVLDSIFGIDASYVRSIQGWVEIIHPEDRAMMEQYLQTEVMAARRPFSRQYRIVRPCDGEVRWVQGLGEGSFDHAGRFLTLVGTIQDITGHKQDLEALRASEEKFVKVFHSAPILVALSRLEDGKLLEVNDRYCHALGFAREELLGRTTVALGIVLAEDREPLVASIKAQDPMQSVEFNMHAKNGQVLPCLFSGELIAVGGETLLISMLTDITVLKQAEAERQSLKAEVEHMQKLESLGRLAGGVAHDMNNVLGAILALASAHLASLPADNPLHPALETIRAAATRGGDMVKRLLAFARQTPSEMHELNLNTLVLEQARLLERTTLAKVHLELELAPDLHPMLGDGSSLTHALMNLCVNAVDAMSEGGTLTLRTRNLGLDQIEVSVADNGSGMPQEVLDRAMEPFFTTKPVGKGTGLGLSLVYTTVNGHQGHLKIQSQLDQGTRVTMTFPAAVSREPGPGQATAGSAEAAGRALRVLLVDDDELVQGAIQMLLEILGHTVTASLTGEAALVLLEQGLQPDVVILDMNMPGLGGKGTIPGLRRLCPRVPVILATGRADQEALDLVAEYPHLTLMSKPFSFEELRGHLQRSSASVE